MLEPEYNAKLREWGALGSSGWTEEGRKRSIASMTGPNNPGWKGGVAYIKRKGNYADYPIKYVRCPQEFFAMARKDGYIMEHRLFVAQAMGRVLRRSEVVHHKNHDPTDNRLENLMLFASNSQHKRYEGTGSPEPLWQL